MKRYVRNGEKRLDIHVNACSDFLFESCSKLSYARNRVAAKVYCIVYL